MSQEGGVQLPDEKRPEFYVDQMRVTSGVFGVAMTYGVSEAHPTGGGNRQVEEKVTLRMSLEHAKIVAMILRRHLKNYERETGTTIQLPANIYTSLGVAAEDW